MKILVTGAAGFIGTHLCHYLVQHIPGLQIVALVRPGRSTDHLDRNISIVRDAMTDPQTLADCLSNVDTVFHLAGVTAARDAAGYLVGNRRSTAVLVQALRHASGIRRVVHVSSLAAAGPCALAPGLDGTEMPRPVSWYGRSKLLAEEVVQTLDTHWTIIRPPVVYGPRDQALLPLFRAAYHGVVPLPCGGRAPLSIVHVRDVCSLLMAAALGAQPSGCILYPSDDIVRSWYDICRLIGASLGRSIVGVPIPASLIRLVTTFNGIAAWCGMRPAYLNPDKYHEAVQDGWLSSGRAAREILGWQPAVQLEEGLADTVRWYRQVGLLPH